MNSVQHQLALIADIQDECRDLAPRTARAILVANFPQKTDSFFKRNLKLVLSLDPEAFANVIGYADPTGEKAIRNVMSEVAA